MAVSYLWSNTATTFTGDTTTDFTLPVAGAETHRVLVLFAYDTADPADLVTFTAEYDTNPTFPAPVAFTGSGTLVPGSFHAVAALRLPDGATGYVRFTWSQPVNGITSLVLLGGVDWPIGITWPWRNTMDNFTGGASGGHSSPLGWTNTQGFFAGFVGHADEVALASAGTTTADSLTVVGTWGQTEVFNGTSVGGVAAPQFTASLTYQTLTSGPAGVGDQWTRTNTAVDATAWGGTFQPFTGPPPPPPPLPRTFVWITP